MRKTISAMLVLACICAAALTGCSNGFPPFTPPGTNETPEPIDISSASPSPAPDAESTAKPALAFTNSLSYGADGGIAELCVTAAGGTSWGEPCERSIAFGETRVFGLETAPDECYDIGATDLNGVNYDVFGVHLLPGDSVELSGSWCTGIFAVNHMNGSRDLYPAVVSRSMPVSAPEKIELRMQNVQLACTDDSGGRIGTLCYARLSLAPADAERFPALAAALETLDEERIERLRAVLIAASAEPGGSAAPTEAPETPTPAPGGEDDDPIETAEPATPGPGGQELPKPSFMPVEKQSGPIAVEKVFIGRADEVCVSLIFETGTENTKERTEAVCSSAAIDTASGERLQLSDVTADVRALPHMLNTSLRAAGETLEINEYRDHTRDFSMDRDSYAFALTDGGICFVFNPNAFRSGCAERQYAFIAYGTDPLLIYLRFLLPEN